MYTREGKHRLLEDTLIQDGVLRNFQVLGEAARRVSESFQRDHADIPWSDMIGMRNVVIHEYEEIDFETLWDTINKDLPVVLDQIEPFCSTE